MASNVLAEDQLEYDRAVAKLAGDYNLGAWGATAVTVERGVTFAGLGKFGSGALGGNRVLFGGDSILSGAFVSQSLDRALIAASGGRLVFAGNIAYFGETSEQMFTRITEKYRNAGTAPSVAPSLPPLPAADIFVMCIGANDVLQNVAPSVTADNVEKIVRFARGQGMAPVVLSLFPSDTKGPETAATSAAIMARCHALGVLTVDATSGFTDPATGGYVASAGLDGTHPTFASNVAAANAVWTALAPMAPPPVGLYPLSNHGGVADGNMVTNPLLLTDGDANSVPDGWVAGGTGTQALVTDAAFLGGKAWQMTCTPGQLAKFANATTFTAKPGDKFLITFQVKVTSVGALATGGGSCTFGFYQNDFAPQVPALNASPVVGGPTRVYGVATCATGFTSGGKFQAVVGGAAGSTGNTVVRVGGFGVYRIT